MTELSTHPEASKPQHSEAYNPHDENLLMIAPVHILASLKDVPHDLRTELTAERRKNAREASGQTLQNVESRKTIERLQIDPVTSLPNAAMFNQEYKNLFGRERLGSFMVIFADVRGLNRVNKHGHEKGDDYLRASAQALRDSVRPTDRIYRKGGDEFVVLADKDVDADIDTISERIQDQATSLIKEYSDLPQGEDLGLYIGAAVKMPDDISVSLLNRADAACVAQKNAYNQANGLESRRQ